MPNLVAGWLNFWCLLWLCWAVMAPIVADKAHELKSASAPQQHICPLLDISHGVGSDLKTFVKVQDLCQSS